MTADSQGFANGVFMKNLARIQCLIVSSVYIEKASKFLRSEIDFELQKWVKTNCFLKWTFI